MNAEFMIYGSGLALGLFLIVMGAARLLTKRRRPETIL